VTHLLTVSGSLRAGSSNSALLVAAARLAPVGLTVSSYDRLADIPAFSPDLEGDAEWIPEPVWHWRNALASADAVLFSSPEYAHGIPGALKNALDWVVGTGELVEKRVGLLSASAASLFAHPQLLEVLTVMNATVVPKATVVIDIPRRGVSPEGLIADPLIADALLAVVAALM
jgi:chromate reductase, NAD(P)H dehydrogenase (quinone)